MKSRSWAALFIACTVCLSGAIQQAAGQVGGRGGVGGAGTGGGGVAGGAGGGGALGGNNQNQQLQQGTGTVDGNERFGRASRQPGEFVGSDSSDTQNFFSQQQNGAFQNQAGRNNRNTNRGNQNFGTQQSRTPNLRRRLHVGFKFPTVSPSTVSQNLSSQFRRISTSSFPVNVQVAMQGRTAILSGTVASTDEAALAVELAKLEPGVSQVRNELTVNSAASSSLNESETLSTEPATQTVGPFDQSVVYPFQEVYPQPFGPVLGPTALASPVIVSP